MEDEFRFGPFSLRPDRRSLSRNGEAVPLGSRAMDVLICLVTHAGEIRTQAQIVAQVWPDTHVEEANLRVHVSGLRKALGDNRANPGFITNVPGRGYMFVAPVTRVDATPGRTGPEARGVPPAAQGRLFGREDAVRAAMAQLAKGRLVTLTGPGGVGKSAVARAILSRLDDGCRKVWIDLSEIDAGERVPTVAATAFGVATRSRDLVGALAQAMDDVPTLVVLDSCEHVVEAATLFVETILAGTASVRFLATSREPLRACGERIHRLQPLTTPAADAGTAEVAHAPAVQLFLERADAALGGYELSDADAPLVALICQRLDGIALAIELAAGRLETMGIAALAASLSDSFSVLTRGRRTALARHQTLRATLDWSYMLLEPAEQRALQALSVFRGRFPAEAAEAVLGGDGAELLAALIAKSLVVLEADRSVTFYRLLDTTRIYAFETLEGAGELEAVMGRLGRHLLGHLEGAGPYLYSGTTEDVATGFAHVVPSLRACLDWAFGETGDSLIGARLTVAALPLFFKLSLCDESLAAVTASIHFLDANPDLDETLRMKLYTALGWPQLVSADEPERGVAAWHASARIAERLGDVDHQLRAVWALWVDAVNRGEPGQGLMLAERFAGLTAASPDPADVCVGRRMPAATLHWLGRHEAAAAGLTEMLADYEYLPAGGHTIRFYFDQKITAHIILSRCRWFLGDEAGALEAVEAKLTQARSIRHTASLSNVLAEAACPLALASDDDALAARYVALLKEHTRLASLDVWHTYAECFESELVQRQGDSAGCLRQLRPNLDQLRSSGFILFEPVFVATEARALSRLGRHAEALGIVDRALARGRRSGGSWWAPELYRERAGICLRMSDAAGAAAGFDAALRMARAAGATALVRRVERDMTGPAFTSIYKSQLVPRPGRRQARGEQEPPHAARSADTPSDHPGPG
ncbi:MAG: winged helix-turn-helix domain-containing protein [Roseovarius sp.]|uniref:ATP-binding protein n=1 Tax=Roseovarius sp. TaxID=1486281 RepID=UPI0032EACE7D